MADNPEGKKAESDRNSPETAFLKWLAGVGLGLAVVWGAVILGVAAILSNSSDPETSILIRCMNASGDEIQRIECAVSDLQQNNALQTIRVDDLATSIEFSGALMGTMMAFFGALITVVVIFFAFRTRSEALAEARNEAQKEAKETSDHFYTKYKIEVNKAYKENMALLETKTEEAIKRIADVDGKIDAVQRQIDEKSLDEKTPLTKEQEDFAEQALAKPTSDRTASDWRAIAFHYIAIEDHLNAALAFGQEASRRTKPANIAGVLFNQALAFGEAGQPTLAIDLYNNLIDWAEPYLADDAAVRQQVAKARFNKAIAYTQHFPEKQPEKAIESYDALIKWAEPYLADDAAVRQQVAMARLNKAATYTEGFPEKQPEKAIEGYDALIKWAEPYLADDAAVRQRVAMAFLGKAATYTEDFPEKQPEKAIEGYDALIKWAEPYLADDAALSTKLLQTYRILGFVFMTYLTPPAPDKSLEASEAGIQLCLAHEMQARSPEYPHLLEHKAEALWALNRKEEAIQLAHKVVTDFADSQDKDIQIAVKEARTKLIEWENGDA